MTHLSISMDNQLAARVRAAAGDNVSGWLAAAARERLLVEAVRAEIAYDSQHGDGGWYDERATLWDRG